MPATIRAARIERKNFWALVFSFLAGVSTSALATGLSAAESEVGSWVVPEADPEVDSVVDSWVVSEVGSALDSEAELKVESEAVTGAESSTGSS